MSKTKQRQATNAAVPLAVSINEKILKECHELYTDDQFGLVKIATELGLNLLAPRKKITVLLIGNHSAGKSSFINWYIEEHVQRVGVAIETQGFTFVTSGKKRESLTGNATLHLYPHFQALSEIEGVVDYLNTEISTSKQKKFPLVTFVDSPGLVDGDMKYPFDVNESIVWLGDLADLIFVFFDPIGQALCKRTLNLVEALNERHPERIRFYLSKADEAGNESDRQRVLMQIVQELCKRPGLNKQGFEMPTIYIPNPNKTARCTNQIEDVCKDVEKTINQTVQNTLNALERDSQQMIGMLEKNIFKDVTLRRRNTTNFFKRAFYYTLAGAFPSLMLLCLLAHGRLRGLTEAIAGSSNLNTLQFATAPVKSAWSLVPSEIEGTLATVLFVMSAFFFIMAQFFCRQRPTLPKKRRNAMQETIAYLSKKVIPRKKELYEEYLRQSVADHDL